MHGARIAEALLEAHLGDVVEELIVPLELELVHTRIPIVPDFLSVRQQSLRVAVIYNSTVQSNGMGIEQYKQQKRC